MLRHPQISILFFLLIFQDAFSQNNTSEISQDCQKNLVEFAKYTKEKNYDKAYQPWLWTFENCPDFSVHIYTYGLKIIEHRYKNSFNKNKEKTSKLLDSVFTQRIKYFPQNIGKIYSDWASSLQNRYATKDAIFEKLWLAFKANPTEMSIKNIAEYFKQVTERNKDTDAQKVFDTYDDVLEAINIKIKKLTIELDKLNEKQLSGAKLTSKEKLTRKNNEINLRGLGQVEMILISIIDSRNITNCEQLLPLYKKSFEANKENPKWLKRAVTRLAVKDCKDNELYPKLVEAWMTAEKSIEGYIHYHDIAKPHRGVILNEYIDKVKDPYKKTDYLLKIAYLYRNRSKSTARSFAHKALEARPNMGEAYLLIANLYASSANKCGDDEFSKRMVYVAAADKVKKAKEVDPSVTAKADRLIKAYMKNAPNTRHSYSKNKKFEIECWIGETVIIP